MQESFQHRNEKNNIQEKLEISMVIAKAQFLFILMLSPNILKSNFPHFKYESFYFCWKKSSFLDIKIKVTFWGTETSFYINDTILFNLLILLWEFHIWNTIIINYDAYHINLNSILVILQFLQASGKLAISFGKNSQ